MGLNLQAFYYGKHLWQNMSKEQEIPKKAFRLRCKSDPKYGQEERSL
jgi:hypothetical protein